MNRRTFFGALVGGTVSSRIAAGSVSGSKAVRGIAYPNRFTQETKFGDYFFYWTGWKKEINAVVNVSQWIAEPAEGELEHPAGYAAFYVRERPAFYASTSGTNGPMSNMQYIMDLSYQPNFPLITDKTSMEGKQEARKEALERLIKYIEDWELPEVLYVGNGHISDRSKLRPGSLIDCGQIDFGSGASIHREGMTMRALRKVVKGV